MTVAFYVSELQSFAINLLTQGHFSAGGGRIQGYNVYMATDEVGDYVEVASTIGADTINVVEILRASMLDDTPLLPQTRYLFKAVAVNLVDVCVSVSSSLQLANATTAWTSAATVPGPPPRPYFLKATGGTITMDLVEPLNMQGAILTGFSVAVDDAGGNLRTRNVSADDEVTFDAMSLTADTNYLVSAAVITDLGISSYSLPITMSTTSATAPTVPRNVVVEDATGSSAVVRWSAPLDTGGIQVTGPMVVI
jgi:hypothetical protein